MTQGEKLEEAKRLYITSNADQRYVLERLFPELKESEDEKNIKNLIDELKCSLRAANCQNDACGGGHEKRIALLEWSIDWLENQGKKVEPIEGFNSEFEKQISRLIASVINKEYEYTEAFIKWISNDFLHYAKHEIEKPGEPIEVNSTEFDLRLNRLLKQFESLSKEELASSLSFYLNVVQNDGTYKDEEKHGGQKSAKIKAEIIDFIKRHMQRLMGVHL